MPHLGWNFFFIFTPLALSLSLRSGGEKIIKYKNTEVHEEVYPRTITPSLSFQTADCSADFIFAGRRYTMGFEPTAEWASIRTSSLKNAHNHRALLSNRSFFSYANHSVWMCSKRFKLTRSAGLWYDVYLLCFKPARIWQLNCALHFLNTKEPLLEPSLVEPNLRSKICIKDWWGKVIKFDKLFQGSASKAERKIFSLELKALIFSDIF